MGYSALRVTRVIAVGAPMGALAMSTALSLPPRRRIRYYYNYYYDYNYSFRR